MVAPLAADTADTVAVVVPFTAKSSVVTFSTLSENVARNTRLSALVIASAGVNRANDVSSGAVSSPTPASGSV